MPNPYDLTMPWHYPVKLEKGNFVGLTPTSNLHNVVVASQHFPGRFNEHALKNPKKILDHVGYSDMQTVYGRPLIMLGSGRSLFYQGHYLKGVGITPLVNNWHKVTDPYHGSGHLLPSSALRELLISDYLHSMGMTDIIVPCTDLLLEESCRARKDMARVTYERVQNKRKKFPEMDKNLSAISVKPGRFCRFSNVLWYLANNAEDNSNTVQFLLNIFAIQNKSDILEKDLQATTIEEAMTNFQLALDKGLTNLVESSLNGIIWGSINNNFALDGRFLDLELPLVFDGPFFGMARPYKVTNENALRFEHFNYAAQMRNFVFYLENFIKAFLQIQKRSQSNRAKQQAYILDLFLKELRNRVIKKSIIFDNERLVDFTFDCMKHFSLMNQPLQKMAKDLISANLNLCHTGDDTRQVLPCKSKLLKQRCELGVKDYHSFPLGLDMLVTNKGTSNQFLNALESVENCKTVEKALRQIKIARKEIRETKRTSLRLSDTTFFSHYLK